VPLQNPLKGRLQQISSFNKLLVQLLGKGTRKSRKNKKKMGGGKREKYILGLVMKGRRILEELPKGT
jgi:hypothetical protein